MIYIFRSPALAMEVEQVTKEHKEGFEWKSDEDY